MSGSEPDSWAAREWAVDAARLAPARRKRKFPTGACQVQGCTSQLEARFHKKHHICAVHIKAPHVAIDGRDMRFCQKCAKFEALEEFEGVKRTCQRALAAHNLARQRRKARERGGVAPGSGRGTGSESSVSAPAAARSGAPAASAAMAAAAAAAGMGAAGASASQAAAAAPPLGLRPASGSLFGSQQASVAGLGEEAAPPGLEDLLEVPALSSALWQAPGPAQQLAAPAPLAGPLPLALAPPAEQLPLAPALLHELLGSSGGSLQADALHQYPTAQHLQQQAVQAQVLAHAPPAAQLAQLAQQAQQAAALAQLQGHPMALMQHAQAQQAQQAMALMPAPAPMPPLPYVSPGTVHRISLKLFGCAPHELGADIRAELESMLHVSVEAVEAAIRPGCVYLTADLFLGPKASAAATMVSAAQLLAAVRCPAALGAAAGNAALLQWQGGVAGTEGGTAGVVTLQHAEPQLVVHPACIVAPATGQLGRLVRLELQLLHQHGSTARGSDPLAGGTVVCRQAGRHVAVEVWGPAATEAAALASAGAPEGGDDTPPSSDDASNDEDGSDSDAAELADSRGVLERPWSSSSSEQGCEVAADATGTAAAAGVWVRPVGLHPGRCEMEVQLPLAGFAVGAAGSAICRPVLLSSAVPLVVLPCEVAAAEVRGFLALCSEQPEAPRVDDLLRDIGTAVGFLWQQQQEQQQADEWPGSEGVDLPPSFVAAAATAAAEHVQHIGGMPRLLALVQRAAAAATAACEAGELVTGQAAGLAQSMPSVQAELASSKSSGLDSPSGSGPSSFRQQAAAAAVDGGSYFDGGDEESSQHCTPPEELAVEAASWGPLAQQARRMPAARWARWAAAITACFFALLLVRLVLLPAHAPVHGGM